MQKMRHGFHKSARIEGPVLRGILDHHSVRVADILKLGALAFQFVRIPEIRVKSRI